MCHLLSVVFQWVVIVVDADAKQQRTQALHQPFVLSQVLWDLCCELHESQSQGLIRQELLSDETDVFIQLTNFNFSRTLKVTTKMPSSPKLWLDIFNYVKEIGVAAWRIQKEHFPDCVESVSRLSDSCWSMCTAAWGGPPWSALYCPAEKKKSKRNIKECSSDNSRNGWQLSNV